MESKAIKVRFLGAGSFDALLGLQAKLYKLYCERSRTPQGAKIPSLPPPTTKECDNPHTDKYGW